MKIALILSGGGRGGRLGLNIPKQYIEMCGKPVICYSIEHLAKHDGIDAIQIVAEPRWQGQIKKWLTEFGLLGKVCGFSNPGRNRQLSIFHGLTDVREYAKDSDHIFIHDAVRPMLSGRQITECLAGLDVAMIPGDEGNFKITTKTDLERFGRIMKARVEVDL